MERCPECDEPRENAEPARCHWCGHLGCEACLFEVMQESTGKVRWCCQGNEECDAKAAEWMDG